jgi:NADH-quinone oxidoreductase subunit M
VTALLLPLLLAIPLAGILGLATLPAERADRIARPLGVAVSIATLALSLVAAVVSGWGRDAGMHLVAAADWVPALGVRFALGIDGVSLPLVLLTTLLTALCCLHLLFAAPAPPRPRSLIVLVLLVEIGTVGTFLALDLVLFFVFFEVVLIPMWLLVAAWGDPHDLLARRRAATTFVLYTVLGSALMLIGLLVVVTQAGTSDLLALTAAAGAGMSRGAQLVAAVALVIGLGVKAPMWPLHTWLPPAHTAAPTVGSVLLAGVLLKMGTYGLVRFVVPVVPEGMREVAPWLGALAVVGIIWGSLACLVQTDLKRLVAYSSVGHMGFVLLGIATLTPAGINGALYANIAHGLITGLLFFLVGAVKDRHGTADLATLGGGLYARAPRLGAIVAFTAIASLGLPGLAGFWGEALAVLGALQPGAGLDRALFVVLAVGAAAGTVLTAAYLLTVIRRVCQGSSAPRWLQTAPAAGEGAGPSTDVRAVEVLAWSPAVILVLALGLWPPLLLGITDPSVRALLGAA